LQGAESADSGSLVGEVEHGEFTGSHTHIDAEELSKEVDSLAQVIAQETGIQVRQSGGTGTYSSISIRGATSAQTDIYFDGVLLNDAAYGGVDLSQIELLNVGSIDIYRGATPVQLGVGNIGGAVNLKSPSMAKPHTKVLLGTGSFGSQRLQLAHQQKSRIWETSFAFTHRKSKNDYQIDNPKGTPLVPGDDVRERRHNGQFERNSLLYKFGKSAGREARIDGLLQLSQRRLGVPHIHNKKDTQTHYDTDNAQFQLNQRRRAWRGGDWNAQHGFYFNYNRGRYDDRYSDAGLGAQNSVTEDNVAGMKSYWEHIGERGTFAIHSELRSDDLEQTDLTRKSDYTANRRALNASMQYSFFRQNEALVLTPALRFAHLRDRYRGVDRFGKDSRVDTSTTLQMGAKYSFAERWQWSANLGQHEREPLFYELFGDRGFSIGNDRLVAEKGVNFDTGLRWLWGAQAGREARLSLFASARDELIVTSRDARGVGRSENTGKASISGVETSIDWRWTDAWSTKLNMTWQSAKNLNEDTAFKGKQLAGEAQFTAHASVNYRRGAWRMWFELQNRRDRYFDTANLLPADAVLLIDAGLAYEYKNNKINFHFLNLSDSSVEDFDRYPKPGRSVEVLFTHQFQ